MHRPHADPGSVDAGNRDLRLTTAGTTASCCPAPPCDCGINDTTTSSIGSVVNWTSAIGQVELCVRTVRLERQYEIHFTRSRRAPRQL